MVVGALWWLLLNVFVDYYTNYIQLVCLLLFGVTWYTNDLIRNSSFTNGSSIGCLAIIGCIYMLGKFDNLIK